MQRLSGMDALFVHQEAGTPMHISVVLIYGPPKADGRSVSFGAIYETFVYRLHASPVFRRKLVTSPSQLDYPYWAEDAEFDLREHLYRVALAKPGDWQQLCTTMGAIHAQGLNMTRPLWEAHVIENLDSIRDLPRGSLAILLKMHHAAIDGLLAAQTIFAIHDLNPVFAEPFAQDDWQGETIPDAWGLATETYIRNMKTPTVLVESTAKLGSATSSVGINDKTPSRQRTRFNDDIESDRVVDGVRFDMTDIKAIRDVVDGASINDVIASIIGGALRSYLANIGELPEHSLMAGTPISEHTGDETSEVSAVALTLCTDVADPLERVQAVHQAAINSKGYKRAVGDRNLSDLSQDLPTRVGALGSRAISAALVIPSVPVPFHTVISNVPGPQVPIYMSGAQLHSLLGLGPLVDDMGLFHAVTSCAGFIDITSVSCKEMMPDIGRYAHCLQQSFEELRSAALS